MGLFNIVVILIYFIFFPIYLLSKYPKFTLLLFAYHTIFVFSYWNSLQNCGADACVYWFLTRFTIGTSDTWLSYFGLSTNFMLFINYPFVNFLKINFLGGFFIYGMVGFMGILNLYKILQHYDYGKLKIQGISLFVIILFLPNMHYWTAGIGKDCLSFFCISYIFLHIVKDKKINFRFLFVCMFMFMVRPHIAIFLLCSVATATILKNKKLAMSKRVVLGALGIIVIPVLVTITLSFVHADFDSLEAINDNFETVGINLAANAGSAVPMSNYILPIKIFTFLFRPFIFDIRDMSTFILAVENTFLFFIFVWAIKLRLKWKIKLPYQIQAIIFFSAITGLFYCYRLTNLGIIIRMKNMLLPFLLAYPLYIISCSRLVTYIGFKKNKNQAL